MKRYVKNIIILSLAVAMMTNTVHATSSSEVKKQKEETEKNLNSIKQNINSLEQKKSNMSA
ncbi:hypothetical protein CG709_11295, partial [Lachnotalea glycerini]